MTASTLTTHVLRPIDCQVWGRARRSGCSIRELEQRVARWCAVDDVNKLLTAVWEGKPPSGMIGNRSPLPRNEFLRVMMWCPEARFPGAHYPSPKGQIAGVWFDEAAEIDPAAWAKLKGTSPT